MPRRHDGTREMKIRFSDGVEFDMGGPLRIEEREDGLYLVGDGMLQPIDTREQGERLKAYLIRLNREEEYDE